MIANWFLHVLYLKELNDLPTIGFYTYPKLQDV